jgi:hypothetical protein
MILARVFENRDIPAPQIRQPFGKFWRDIGIRGANHHEQWGLFPF